MKKFLTSIVAVAAFATGVIFTTAFTNNKSNAGAANHPRIAKAVASMQDAIDYLNSAPDVFQGHKATAIADTKAAIAELKICEQYPAK
jgi:hypothetical protein